MVWAGYLVRYVGHPQVRFQLETVRGETGGIGASLELIQDDGIGDIFWTEIGPTGIIRCILLRGVNI